jgi:hypothetical protein
MTSDSLAVRATDSDAEVVKKANSLPVDVLVPGLIVASVGLAALIVGLIINPNPIEPQQVIELADE